MMSELRQMALEPGQLFGNIGAIGENGHLLEQAFVLERKIEPGFFEPFPQRRAIFFHHVGIKRADFLDLFPQSFQAMDQILGEMFAFAFPHFD